MGTLTARLRWLAHRLLWAGLVPVVVFLTLDYKNNGSKPSSEVSIVELPVLELPWIMFDGFFGKNGACYIELETCNFGTIECLQAMERVHEGWMENERTLSTSYLHSAFLLNPKKLARIGVTFSNLAEFLNLKFVVKNKLDGSLVSPGDLSVLCSPFLDELSTTITYLGHTRSVDKGVAFDGNSKSRLEPNWDNRQNEWAAEKQSVSANGAKYITVGLGNLAILEHSFSIFCLGGCDGGVQEYRDYVNRSSISVSQFSKHTQTYYEVRLQPASFSIMTVSQKDGTSIFDLLGTIFGWVGILTGACIYTITDELLSWTRAFVKKTATAVKNLENATGLKLQTDEDESESAAVYEELSNNLAPSFKNALKKGLRDDEVDVGKIRYNLD
eukprot:TRINITY_DN9762_c0_g1_i1.p1 TRINITY_DN9762_c0_g1~~TRINITY_DN9762_c0_g1_i1.p1  ORF type:complete len:404 (+),score=51.87 TRINITY_DN9762_c0_g1_i1:56-1213(+)